MIQICNVGKVFRLAEVETTVLKNISLEVKEGEFIAILGPSGCGKSTLLNIIGLLDSPTEGSYKLFGKEVANLQAKERTQMYQGKISFVFQILNLIDELNIYSNIELPLVYLGIKVSARKKIVNNMLQRIQISHRARQYPYQLPEIHQRRAVIARAAITLPKLILIDEPTGKLNSQNSIQIMNLLTELSREGFTIIMATHSQYEASYAHRIIELFDGTIIK